MSFLRPDDRSSRSRSKSAAKDRSRSRSSARAPKAPSPPSTVSKSRRDYPSSQPRSGPDNGLSTPSYEVRAPSDRSQAGTSYFPPPQAGHAPYPPDDEGFTMGGWTDFPPNERPGYIPAPNERQYGATGDSDDDLAYGGPASVPQGSNQRSSTNGPVRQPSYPLGGSSMPSVAQYRYTPQASGAAQTPSYTANTYQSTPSYQYAPPPDKIAYTTKPQTSQQPISYTQAPQQAHRHELPRTYSKDAVYPSREPLYKEVAPSGLGEGQDRKSKGSKQRLSVSTQQPGLQAPSSSRHGPRMDRLSVSGNRPDLNAFAQGGNLPPPSPLLEAYHGTYQSLSPMPGAFSMDDGDLDDLPPLSPVPSSVGAQDRLAQESREKKRVKVYDPEADASTLARALNHHKIDADAVCDVLPTLSHDQLFELGKEYKKQVKIQGKGVNLSKHIKLKLTGNFGKAAYVTALGRWESEGYWANFWYQSHSSRRELLIESLMGRTNAEIREIKDAFKDKRYGDSLTRCMEKELKMDKFRTAILLALEARRQEEQDRYPIEYLERDLAILRNSVVSKGGESAMLEIVVRRSDRHLRDLLKAYKDEFRKPQYDDEFEGSFAVAALNKSNNLVGEVVTHILNGAINKPQRDARLLNHAIKDIADHNKSDELRYELLISRLIRLHWDRLHLSRVKRDYQGLYGKYLEEDIEDATKGDLREFLCELCQTAPQSK